MVWEKRQYTAFIDDKIEKFSKETASKKFGALLRTSFPFFSQDRKLKELAMNFMKEVLEIVQEHHPIGVRDIRKLLRNQYEIPVGKSDLNSMLYRTGPYIGIQIDPLLHRWFPSSGTPSFLNHGERSAKQFERPVSPLTYEQIVSGKQPAKVSNLAEVDKFVPLTHFTRDLESRGTTARQNLESILLKRTLLRSNRSNGIFHFSSEGGEAPPSLRACLRVVCFTGSPISQLPKLLSRPKREPFSPYGLIFDRKRLCANYAVNPVVYLNTYNPRSRNAVEGLKRLIVKDFEENGGAEEIRPILPMFSTFGQALSKTFNVDYLHEQEWRCAEDINFTRMDILFGLCPEDEVEEFESRFQIDFIDPRFPGKFEAKILRRVSEWD